jgi:hypothetical protein
MFSTTHFKRIISGSFMDILIEELIDKFSSSVSIGAYKSEGSYGKTYPCQILGEDCVIKIQKYKKDKDEDVFSEIGKQIKLWSGEIEKMLYLQDLDLSPYIYYYGFYYDETLVKLYNVIIMEKLQVSEKLIESGTVDIIDITLKTLETMNNLINVGVSHRDYKWDNIGCRITHGVLTVVPFDFGISRYTTKSQDKDVSHIDRIRLITTTMGLKVGITNIRIMYNLIRTKDMPLADMIKTHIHVANLFSKFNKEYFKLYHDTFVEA